MPKERGFTHGSTYNESQEWYTPPEIFNALNLWFDMDVASPGADAVPWIPAAKHLTIKENGLVFPWEGLVWCNPPYGMDTPEWVKRCAQYGNAMMLVFSRTDTAWFHDWAALAAAVCFIRGRVKFIRADGFQGGGCGAGSMLLAFGETAAKAVLTCGLGTCARIDHEHLRSEGTAVRGGLSDGPPGDTLL